MSTLRHHRSLCSWGNPTLRAAKLSHRLCPLVDGRNAVSKLRPDHVLGSHFAIVRESSGTIMAMFNQHSLVERD